MDEAAENRRLVLCIAARGTGAADAERALCRRFAPRAELYGRKHLRDHDAARDLAQAVVVAVLESARAGNVAEPEKLDRFVLGTCRNLALRMRRANARAEPTDVAVLDAMAFETELVTPDQGALLRCLGELDERGRQVVFQSFNAGDSTEEIAAVLELAPGHVRVLRHRAIAQLRECMDDCSEERR